MVKLLKNTTQLKKLMTQLDHNSPSLPTKRSALKKMQERRSLSNKRIRCITLPEMMPRTTSRSKRHLSQSLQLSRRGLRLLRMKRRRPLSKATLPIIRMPRNKPIRSSSQVKPTLRESRKLPKLTRLMKPPEKLKLRLK